MLTRNHTAEAARQVADPKSPDPNRYTARFREPLFGWFLLVAVGFIAGSLAAANNGYSPAGAYGLAAAIFLVGFGVVLRVTRFKSRRAKALALRQEYGKLEAQLTKLRAEEARARGDFDRFGKSD